MSEGISIGQGAVEGPFVPAVLDLTASTTLTGEQSGAVVLLDAAAGLTVTLPTPAIGLVYTFIVKTTVTSNAYKIITDAATTFLLGSVGVPIAAGTQALFFANGTSHRSVNMNGSTTGGLLGGIIAFTCIDATQWQVNGNLEGSGTVATPFATS
jgi:hypothetical protein